MKKIVFFLTLLSLSIKVSSQNTDNEKVYIMIDSIKYSNLYFFEKQDGKAKIKILYFNERNQGFKMDNKIKSNKDIIVLNPEPGHTNYYEFNSINHPKIIKDINDLKINGIEEISKNDKNVWQKYPFKFYFIEKLKSGKYNVWEMITLINE